MISQNEIIKQFKDANFEVFYNLYKTYSRDIRLHNIILLIELFQMLSLIMQSMVRNIYKIIYLN
jgi:hypothetical protein